MKGKTYGSIDIAKTEPVATCIILADSPFRMVQHGRELHINVRRPLHIDDILHLEQA